ncbi:Beta propeller domain protein [Caldicellulosiruptor hydrothermalis 108]|uniref:Beta propeller domain protein n=1 Tax=Caldicellulosiruptor hydrothermalis (strain DSM 18901 / VKM B-2411 / 108) TaxID=632292 RepID=E4Q9A5_CALH1|nr:beta-propeller domain-containing protein [Caldicellulosiruptor hydrothermalis]ADQ05776.1 Beta propeller domain protein [Caldicellulosiruptor hydrothermalis 108]
MLRKYLLGVLVVLFIVSFSDINFVMSDQSKPKSFLQKVGTFSNFKKLIDDAIRKNPYMGSSENFLSESIPQNSVKGENKTGSEYSYSQTNVQVMGVDEADIAKTDGQYIYIAKPYPKIKDNGIVIVKAYPPEEMKIFSKIKLSDELYPEEFYVDSRYLVVICEKAKIVDKKPIIQKNVFPDIDSNKVRVFVPYQLLIETYCIVYDISDKSNPKEIRRVSIAGKYLISRKISTNLYIVTEKQFPYEIYVKKAYSEQDFKPYFTDSITGDSKKIYIGFDKIKYIPDFINCSITIVGSFNIESKDEICVECVLGGGDIVYCSQENLYLCSEVIKKVYLTEKLEDNTRLWRYFIRKTMVCRFELSKGKATLMAAGVVNGKVLNQFSMDEQDSYFRIATTGERPYFPEEGYDYFNAVYVLDKNLRVVGKIDNIAKGERIYSARFIGKRLYLVTFKALDPFFVIDLEDPHNPKVLGYLKIPGYSTYLHPYDEIHIIGFGMDAEDLNERYAIPLGLKIAMFNVEDVKNPKELFKVIIGEKGSYSELLNNHKALLFDKNKNIFAFPVEVYDKKGHNFTGAYVYSIDLKEGFVLRGKISHEIDGRYCEKIDRLLYIGDVLYSVSNSMIKASSLENLKEIAKVRLD